ncbi:hypothetical protein C4J94_2999 [Pseudomonas sp. R5-89-07]|nr:hypothetical protein C4J94_2999 [Pseudomonas sp. R5-89-07]
MPCALPRICGLVSVGRCGARVQFVEVLLLEQQSLYIHIE